MRVTCANVQKLQNVIYPGSSKVVCDDALDAHVWVSEISMALQEGKVLEALQT